MSLLYRIVRGLLICGLINAIAMALKFPWYSRLILDKSAPEWYSWTTIYCYHEPILLGLILFSILLLISDLWIARSWKSLILKLACLSATGIVSLLGVLTSSIHDDPFLRGEIGALIATGIGPLYATLLL